MPATDTAVRFMDNREFKIGDTIEFSHAGSSGLAVVRGFTKRGATRVLIDPAPDAVKGSDYWVLGVPAADGRIDFWGVRDHGVPGGSIVRKVASA